MDLAPWVCWFWARELGSAFVLDLQPRLLQQSDQWHWLLSWIVPPRYCLVVRSESHTSISFCCWRCMEYKPTSLFWFIQTNMENTYMRQREEKRREEKWHITPRHLKATYQLRPQRIAPQNKLANSYRLSEPHNLGWQHWVQGLLEQQLLADRPTNMWCSWSWHW